MTAKKTTNKAPATPKAAAAPRLRSSKAKGDGVKVDATVTANARVRNAEATKRGPGRPPKVLTGNLYEVTYQGTGKSADAPQTKVVRAPDSSTAICAANKLNSLENTFKFIIRATLINSEGQPLDPTYIPGDDAIDLENLDVEADDAAAAELLDKPVTTTDPLQAQNTPQD
jgi:hypothetical protein